MNRRTTHLAAAIGASLLAGCAPSDAGPPPARPAHARALIVLGIDGMDPELTRGLLERGEMPNLAALIAEGGFSELDTANPPQSPVAWSSFITGLGPEGHGIYDFVHRDPRALAPYLSTSRTHAPEHVLELGGFALGFGGSPDVQLLRQGDAFWQVLEHHGVPATVVKVPANYPPAGSRGAESMSGMGTPDLLGTYGTFQLATDDARLLARPLKAGIAHRLAFRGDRAAGQLAGPPNPTRTSGAAMTLSLEVVRDPERDVALVRLGDREVVLTAGEWSEWTPVAFDPGALGGEVSGMVRLYLRQVRPTFHLYISPINLDPLDPAMPLSSPARYAADLARDIGRFYTQGMPEDTKALASGALAPREFLSIADRVMGETEAALRRELARFRGGFLFVYLSSIDQTSHVFFRSLDPQAPAEDRAFADAIPALYRRVDGWIGLVRERMAPGTTLVVMSDHGFAHYRTKVHLNAFLARRGYLALHPPGRVRPGPLGHIDWSRTQAYAFGLNQVFVNLRGREARGAVPPAEREMVLDRLERDLLALRDPASGSTAITRVERPAAGRFADRAPDLLIGYRAGFRSSDESALGQVGEQVFQPNRDRWSGDHCMDPAEVPGVLASNAALAPPGRRPGLADMAPSILSYFGIQPPAGLAGRPVLRTR
jgi:predicted AlkP superfamily phosphohydrolase/phosphomutase